MARRDRGRACSPIRRLSRRNIARSNDPNTHTEVGLLRPASRATPSTEGLRTHTSMIRQVARPFNGRRPTASAETAPRQLESASRSSCRHRVVAAAEITPASRNDKGRRSSPALTRASYVRRLGPLVAEVPLLRLKLRPFNPIVKRTPLADVASSLLHTYRPHHGVMRGEEAPASSCRCHTLASASSCGRHTLAAAPPNHYLGRGAGWTRRPSRCLRGWKPSAQVNCNLHCAKSMSKHLRRSKSQPCRSCYQDIEDGPWVSPGREPAIFSFEHELCDAK